MCTWTLLDLKTLGSQPIVSKNLPKHCHGGDPNLDMYYGPSTWSTFMLHWAWGIHYYKIGVLFCMVWSLDDFQGPIDFMAKHKSAMKLKAMQKTTKKLIVWSRYIYIKFSLRFTLFWDILKEFIMILLVAKGLRWSKHVCEISSLWLIPLLTILNFQERGLFIGCRQMDHL